MQINTPRCIIPEMAEVLRSSRLSLDKLVFSPETGIARTPIDSFLVVKRNRNSDERGSFQEFFRVKDVYKAIGESVRPILQPQESWSKLHVLRGMHAGPEDKFIVPRIGKFLVAVADVRKSSPTFGSSLTLEFDATDPTGTQAVGYFVRRGIANGFLVLDAGPLGSALYIYNVTGEYDKTKTSMGFKYDDPQVGIDWPKSVVPLLSDKDLAQPSFVDFIAKVDQGMYE